MRIFKTYEYALKPTEEQKKAINALLDKQDEVYNQMVRFANGFYWSGCEIEFLNSQLRELNFADVLPPKAEASVKAKVSSQIKKLYEGTISVIFERKNFKDARSIDIPFEKIVGKYLYISGLGYIEMVFHRGLPESSKIFKSVLKSEGYGKRFYVSLGISFDRTRSAVNNFYETSTVIGLDYKQDGLYVDSNGNSGEYPGFYVKNKQKLNELYATAGRFKKGGRRWLKFMRRAEKLEKHIYNQRKDWQFKKASELANENSAVCIETLNFGDMVKENAALSSKIYDNQWGGFKNKLKSKLDEQGNPLIQTSQYYPSSQGCSCCGWNMGKQPLNVRTIVCPNCGNIMDRDMNAALNIRDEGLRLLDDAA